MADPYYGLQADFSQRIQALINASGGRLTVGSGFRTRAQQQVLYDRYKAGVPGQARAAAPGHSQHEFGLAVDLQGDLEWAHAHAAEYGIYFPMEDEPWHAQPSDKLSAKLSYQQSMQSAGISPEDDMASRLMQIQHILLSAPPSGSTPGALSNSPIQDRYLNSIWQATNLASRNTPSDVSQLSGKPSDLQRYAASQFSKYGWDQSELSALIELWNKESSWNPAADNPKSSAAGIAQKMQSIHGPVESTPQGQIDWGLQYIANRYGSPSAALKFHNQRNFY